MSADGVEGAIESLQAELDELDARRDRLVAAVDTLTELATAPAVGDPIVPVGPDGRIRSVGPRPRGRTTVPVTEVVAGWVDKQSPDALFTTHTIQRDYPGIVASSIHTAVSALATGGRIVGVGQIRSTPPGSTRAVMVATYRRHIVESVPDAPEEELIGPVGLDATG